jgi:hypothetical protein
LGSSTISAGPGDALGSRPDHVATAAPHSRRPSERGSSPRKDPGARGSATPCQTLRGDTGLCSPHPHSARASHVHSRPGQPKNSTRRSFTDVGRFFVPRREQDRISSSPRSRRADMSHPGLPGSGARPGSNCVLARLRPSGKGRDPGARAGTAAGGNCWR